MIFADVQAVSPWWLAVIIGGVTALGAAGGGISAFILATRKLRSEHEDVVCARLKASHESFYHGLMIVDRELIILSANKQARAITGYGAELVGKSIYDLVPSEFRDKHREHVRRFFNDPHTRRMGGNQKFPMVDRYGERKMLVISLSPFENVYGQIELTVGMDVIQE